MIGSLFVATLFCVAAMGQQPRRYPPFTLVTRLTEYDANDRVLRVSTSVHYHSSSGDWRVVSKPGYDEQATLYRRGRGVYQSFSRTHRIIKMTDHAPGCPLRTGEELRRDPMFSRTEEVLGFTAYVLVESRAKDSKVEHYYVPELGGGTPFKQVTTYTNGRKFVHEPLSVKLAEPDAIDVTGPDYLVIEQEPVFLRDIGEQLLSKPAPEYPPDALFRRLSGYANVTVTIDETGRVIAASAASASVPQSLRDAAVEAAYKATFKPAIVDGRAVVASGIMNYQFVLPKQLNGSER